jgi:hypothetical protein
VNAPMNDSDIAINLFGCPAGRMSHVCWIPVYRIGCGKIILIRVDGRGSHWLFSLSRLPRSLESVTLRFLAMTVAGAVVGSGAEDVLLQNACCGRERQLTDPRQERNANHFPSPARVADSTRRGKSLDGGRHRGYNSVS